MATKTATAPATTGDARDQQRKALADVCGRIEAIERQLLRVAADTEPGGVSFGPPVLSVVERLRGVASTPQLRRELLELRAEAHELAEQVREADAREQAERSVIARKELAPMAQELSRHLDEVQRVSREMVAKAQALGLDEGQVFAWHAFLATPSELWAAQWR